MDLQEGTMEWPVRSPDLAPLDFFLWGHIKKNVYVIRSGHLQALKTAIQLHAHTVQSHKMFLQRSLETSKSESGCASLHSCMGAGTWRENERSKFQITINPLMVIWNLDWMHLIETWQLGMHVPYFYTAHGCFRATMTSKHFPCLGIRQWDSIYAIVWCLGLSGREHSESHWRITSSRNKFP